MCSSKIMAVHLPYLALRGASPLTVYVIQTKQNKEPLFYMK
jgi:hypothetical protein